MNIISEEKLLEELKIYIESCGTLTNAAKSMEVGVSYLCDCLHGRTVIGPKISKKLGYTPIRMYRKLIKMTARNGYFEQSN